MIDFSATDSTNDPQEIHVLAPGEDLLVMDGLKFNKEDLKDDLLDFGYCSPHSDNPIGVEEDWFGTESGVGMTSNKNFKNLVTKYCQKCPVRWQCWSYAVLSKIDLGVSAVHPKYRKKRVVQANLHRTFKQMFAKLDRAFANLEEEE